MVILVFYRGSNPRRVTISRISDIYRDSGFFFCFQEFQVLIANNIFLISYTYFFFISRITDLICT